MSLKCLSMAALAFLPLACSDAAAAADAGAERDGDDGHERIVPPSLTVSALPGGNGVLEVVALTLREGTSHHELYAALRNLGDVPACHAALAVELFDHDDRSLAAGINGLLTQDFYRLRDGSGSVAACVAPGATTMGAISDLPRDFALQDVATVVYRCPYFALEVDRIAGLAIDGLQRVDARDGSAYRGELLNGLDVAVSRPSVTVFALSRASRPLTVATSTSAQVLAPGERWSFETSAVSERGVDHAAAFPAGALATDARPQEEP